MAQTVPRVQESPFRETEWDQRLDSMLDDLKNTVGDSDASESHVTSSFRSSSRSESRSNSRAGSATRTMAALDDGGRMKHSRREYTSPDNSSHVVSEQYEYDTGDGSNARHFQKKVMKSTYSSYATKNSTNTTPMISSTTSTSSNYIDKEPVPELTPPEQGTKVISASQTVANKLVDALSSIGMEDTVETAPSPEDAEDPPSASDTLKTSSDYSTLTRLRKNISELDVLIDSLEENQRNSATSNTLAEIESEIIVVQETTESVAVPNEPEETPPAPAPAPALVPSPSPSPPPPAPQPEETSTVESTEIVTQEETTSKCMRKLHRPHAEFQRCVVQGYSHTHKKKISQRLVCSM